MVEEVIEKIFTNDNNNVFNKTTNLQEVIKKNLLNIINNSIENISLFLGNLYVESWRFTRTKENMNHSPESLTSINYIKSLTYDLFNPITFGIPIEFKYSIDDNFNEFNYTLNDLGDVNFLLSKQWSVAKFKYSYIDKKGEYKERIIEKRNPYYFLDEAKYNLLQEVEIAPGYKVKKKEIISGNLLYGGRNEIPLDYNNIDVPQDGFKYIGRGLIQLTGKDNYERIIGKKDLSYEDVLKNEDAEISLEISSKFWKKDVEPNYAEIKIIEKDEELTKIEKKTIFKIDKYKYHDKILKHVLGGGNYDYKADRASIYIRMEKSIEFYHQFLKDAEETQREKEKREKEKREKEKREKIASENVAAKKVFEGALFKFIGFFGEKPEDVKKNRGYKY